uniref:glycogenin glucosyltransferase n=1 Tax=Amphilophus citrinellus TaxID=61819 RepID=A0A3Q0S671_AMPCI
EIELLLLYLLLAFVTLATTDSYCMGATVVARSLRRHGTTRHIVVMITPNISEQSRLALKNVFDDVIVVDVMDSEDSLHLSLLGRPELGITFTKIHCWTLTQYSKCVFLDADTLVLCNVDELFERDELSAAPDPGWPDCFNSGVFVFRPSLHTHTRLLDHARHHGSFDGGDQGLLNSFFSGWSVEDISKHLPFIYNLSVSSVYSYLPAFQQFGHGAKIIHFLGGDKPWKSQGNGSGSRTMEQFVSLWWKEYLIHTTPSAPAAQPKQEQKKPQQQVWEGGAAQLTMVQPALELNVRKKIYLTACMYHHIDMIYLKDCDRKPLWKPGWGQQTGVLLLLPHRKLDTNESLLCILKPKHRSM